MTVGELIELLQTFPATDKVIAFDGYGMPMPAIAVKRPANNFAGHPAETTVYISYLPMN